MWFWHVLALRFGRPVSELQHTMTRREFLTWVAFARVYPVIEHEPPDFETNAGITPDIVARVKAHRAIKDR